MNKFEQWNKSYHEGENVLFYPNEEIIRFVNTYISKKSDYNQNQVKIKSDGKIRALDIGSGVGRHIKYGLENGIDMHGIDLSSVAVDKSKEWLGTIYSEQQLDNIKQGSAAELPWAKGYFDFLISHGVLDSMPYELAKEVVKEAYRVLKAQSYFYCDLISGDALNFYKEKEVEYEHEQGTIQSYFNEDKIRDLFNPYFEIIELKLNETTYLKGQYEDQTKLGRYHVILKKKG